MIKESLRWKRSQNERKNFLRIHTTPLPSQSTLYSRPKLPLHSFKAFRMVTTHLDPRLNNLTCTSFSLYPGMRLVTTCDRIPKGASVTAITDSTDIAIVAAYLWQKAEKKKKHECD